MWLNLICNEIALKMTSFIARYKYFFFFLLFLFFFIKLLDKSSSQESIKIIPQYLPLKSQLCLENTECIKLEVAESSAEKNLGLMQRVSLHGNSGMLFPFNPPKKVAFWMYKMLFSVDMIFIFEGQVVAVISNVPICSSLPCPTYGPESPVDGVIELVSGEAKRLNIKQGKSISINSILVPAD